MKCKSLTYKKSGVDTTAVDTFIRTIKKYTHSERVGNVGAFASVFGLDRFMKKYKKPMLVSSADGVGTKLKIASQLGVHHTVGIDLVAMNVNDIICVGARPLFFTDYIAYGRISPKILTAVVRGIGKGLRDAQCVLLGGETAQMPGMYTKGEYDLAGFCVGIVEPSRIIDGSRIRCGDVVIGLTSSGLHSNGFSLVRKALTKREIKNHAKEILRPTRIYVKPILSSLEAFRAEPRAIKGIAHVTGGAFYQKATKILPPGLGMVIEKKSWKVPNIFKLIQERAHLDDKEMYSVFNMGIGMIVVTAKKYAPCLKRKLSQYYPAHIIGEVVRSKTKAILR